MPRSDPASGHHVLACLRNRKDRERDAGSPALALEYEADT
jgi:hypothetical protein